MKKCRIIMALALLLCLGCGSALAAPAAEFVPLTGTAIYVNNQYLPLDTMPLLAEGTTFVPLRVVSSALGAEVSWQNGEAKIVQGGKTITLRPGEPNARVNGQSVRLAAAPRQESGRIMVPLRFVSEQLGATVQYADHVVDIHPAAGTVLPDIPKQRNGTRVDDTAEYIYYADYDGKIWRVDRQTLEQEELPITPAEPLNKADTPSSSYSGLNVWNGKIYCSGNYSLENKEGRLTIFDPATGQTTYPAAVDNWLNNKSYRYQILDGWLYYQSAPGTYGDLYRVALADGEPQGTPQKLASNIYYFWFVGDALYYSDWSGKYFQANLDGSNKHQLTFPEDAVGFWGCDAGWYYCMEYGGDDEYQKLCRMRPGDQALQEIFDITASGRFDDFERIQVVGNYIYVGVCDLVEYMPGKMGSKRGAVWRMDLNGQKMRQVTQRETADFYVFRDVILYYDVTDTNNPVWRVQRLD